MPVFSFNNVYNNETILPKMVQSTTNTAHPHPPTIFTDAYLYLIECLTKAIRYLWAQYNHRLAFLEERVALPKSELTFIITGLLAFAAMKSQCQPGFPYITHPLQVSFSINSLIMYGFSCAAAAALIASVQKHRALKT